MNFTINNKTLLMGVDAVSDAVCKGAKKDYRGEGLIEIKPFEDKLQIVADGGFIAMSLDMTKRFDPDIVYSFTSEGNIIVNIKELENALRSFYPSDLLTFEMSDGDMGRVLYIKNAQQEDRFQMVSVMEDVRLGLRPKSEKFNASVTVDKDVFIKGMSSISFAFFYRSDNEPTNCFVFDTNVDSATFITGCMAQFAWNSISGKVVDAKSYSRIIFPWYAMPPILSIFKKLPVSNISISDFYGDVANEKMSQIYIKTEVAVMEIRGKDEKLQNNYPFDIAKYSEKEYDNVFSMRVSDLKMPTKGIVATRDFEITDRINNEDYHYVIMDFDFESNQVTLATNTKLKSKSKISIGDVKTDGTLGKIMFSSKFLSDIVDKCGTSDIINFHKDVDMIAAGETEPYGSIAYVTYNESTNETAGITEKLNTVFWVFPAGK